MVPTSGMVSREIGKNFGMKCVNLDTLKALWLKYAVFIHVFFH